MHNVPKILILVHARQHKPGHLNWVAFRDMLQDELGSAAEVSIAALSELVFVIHNGNAQIFDETQRINLEDYDLVIFRTVGRRLEEAIAVAAYCRKKGIKYIDQYIPKIGNTKLSCAYVRWEHDIRVPSTLYGPKAAVVAEIMKDYLGWPLVVKANDGKKGRDNYLAHSVAELTDILNDHPSVVFVIQAFIPNDGDYRLLTLNGQVRLAIHRRAKQGSHLNNTSQGGSAQEVLVSSLPPTAVELAERATALEQLYVAGTDVVIDKVSGEPYILEVNRAPQLATGAIAEKKMQVYAASLKELLV